MTVTMISARIGQIQQAMAQLTATLQPPVATPSTTATSATATSATSRSAAEISAGGRTGATAGADQALFATALATAQAVGTGSAATSTTPATTSGTPVAAGTATGDDLVAAARKYLGTPYVWGGESLAEGGLDCSGLVQLAMKDLGVEVPRTARQQMTIGTEVASLAQARPGDLIVTRGGGHVMIYLGDNQVLHSPRPGQDVQIRDMFETDADITSIRRVLPTGGQDLATAGARDVVTAGSR
ncbi:C40 family peptidase [Occultella aeris]|uniref:Murein DD-endopeptidase MepH n=1 Tax=Occultella aeris TaxID=2761496 RepID=A0A7M4DDG8_9MICO|nr:C40 family peptidase [Occultella aeris]VZO34887.1 Murein DD-endopeptidase MepH precursor [Occultella aeris]